MLLTPGVQVGCLMVQNMAITFPIPVFYGLNLHITFLMEMNGIYVDVNMQ